MNQLFTISVVTFNNLQFTKNFLDSLFCTTKTPFDLVVVDNASTDGTQEYLKKFEKQRDVRLIINNKNNGFGYGHNRAFELCKTKYIVPMNNDIVLPQYFIDRAFQTALSHPEYKQLGAMQKKNVEETNKLTTKEFTPEIFTIKAPQDFVSGSFFIAERDLINSVGGLFDERFEIGFCEDVDLSWRLGIEQHKLGYISNLYYTHFGNTTFDNNADKILSKKTYYIENTKRLLNKWDTVIKKELQKQLSAGKDVPDLIVVTTAFKERNFYKNCNQRQFKVDLLSCLDSSQVTLVDLIEKYQKFSTVN